VRLWLLALVLFVGGTYVLFAPCLASGPLINAPETILRLPLLSWYGNIPRIFNPDFMMFTEGQYRPLSYALLAILRTFVSADNVLFYHAFFVAFHALNAMLVFAVARLFVRHLLGAFLAAGLFAAHPLASVFVNDVYHFHYVLATTFYLIAFLCHVRFVRTRRYGWLAAVLVLFVLGVLSDKVMLTFPVAALGWSLLYERARTRATLVEALSMAGILLLMSPCWFYFAPNPLFFSYAEFAEGTVWHSFLSFVGCLGRYLAGLAGGYNVPAPLDEMARRLRSLDYWEIWLWGAALVAAAVLAVRCLRRRQWAGFGILLMILGLVPYCSTLFNHTEMFVSWSYLYLPLVGFTLLVGALLEGVVSLRDRKARAVAMVAAVMPVVALGAALMRCNFHETSAQDHWGYVLAMNPKSETALVETGKAFLARGNVEAALRYLFPPVLRSQSIPSSSLVMASWYARAGDLPAAMIHLHWSRAASAEVPMQIGPESTLAPEVLREMGCLDYAEQYLGSLVMVNPANVEALKDLAPILAMKGHVRAAVRMLRYAGALDPYDGETKRLLADFTERQYEPDTPGREPVPVAVPCRSDWLRYVLGEPASHSIRRTVIELSDRRPADPIIQLESAIALVQEHDNKRALEKAERATILLTNHSLAWAVRCRAAGELGKYDEALEAGRNALVLNPRDAAAWHNVGYLYSRLGNFNEALECYRTAVKLNPKVAVTQFNFADILARKERYAEALPHYEKAFELGINTADAWNAVGLVNQRLGKADEAVKCYRKALALEPRSPRSYLQLAISLQMEDKFAEASRVFTDGMKACPGEPEILSGFAWMLATARDEKVRDGAKAVRLAQEAVRLAKTPVPELHDILAAAWAETGDFEKAVEAESRAIELAQSAKNDVVRAAAASRLAMYQRKIPYRMPAPTAPR
jgi:tetratricopeptide (TPR) repeat protein